VINISGEFAAADIAGSLKDVPAGDILAVEDDQLTLALDGTSEIPGILEALFTAGIMVTDLKIQSPNLETVFLKLTGRSLRD